MPGDGAAPVVAIDEGRRESFAGDKTILRPATDTDADVAEGHALLLRIGGRRRLVLSVAAADRALKRAAERGQAASVELVRVVTPAERRPGRLEVRRDDAGRLVPNVVEGM